jgi:hypothetical protein
MSYIFAWSTNVRQSAASLHLLSFGDYALPERRHQSKKIDRKISYLLVNVDSDFYRYESDLLWAFQPAPAIGDSSKMAIYENRAKYDAERRTIGKPARMIKRICPILTESQCNDFAVWWKETFEIDEVSYVITESAQKDDFVSAYNDAQSKTFDPSFDSILGHSFKSLQASCMRHDFDDLPIHPAAAYASGDFKIVIAKDSDGNIAARCVVSVAQGGETRAKGFAGPVYTTSDTVSRLMAQYLESTGCIPKSNWAGSHMVKIPHDMGVILPYIDGMRDLTDCGDFLVFERHGDITANQTSGYVKTQGETCEQCGDSYDSENEGSFIDGHGCICGNCLENEFTYCEYSGEHVPNSETVTVYSYGRNRINSDTVSRYNAEHSGNFVLCSDGEFWSADDVVYVDSYGEYFPLKSDEIFVSTVDGEYYHTDDMVLHNDLAMTSDQKTAILEESANKETVTTETVKTAMNDFEQSLAKLEACINDVITFNDTLTETYDLQTENI